jgi:hypothetical protein
LLYSLVELREIVGACLKAVAPRAVVEVGSEHGSFTTWLLANAPRECKAVYVIEPAPAPAVEEMVARSPRGRLIRGHSPAALSEIPNCDAYFIDGDHNYATVRSELEWIAGRGEHPFPLVCLHDVCWPWGRRDLYHDPDRLPAHERHEYSEQLGPKPGLAELAEDGFGAGTLKPAVSEGGARNGVRTAVADFLDGHPAALTYREVPLVFGLGVLYAADAPHAAALDEVLGPLDRHAVLARVEENRVGIFARLLELAAQGGRDAAAIAELVRERNSQRTALERSATHIARLEAVRERHEALMASRPMRWSAPARRTWYRLKGH